MDPRMNRIMIGIGCLLVGLVQPFIEAFQIQSEWKKAGHEATVMEIVKMLFTFGQVKPTCVTSNLKLHFMTYVYAASIYIFTLVGIAFLVYGLMTPAGSDKQAPAGEE